VLAIIWKDLVLEARSRETVASLFVLGVLVLVIFNFAVDIAPDDVADVRPGVLWIAIVFSATLALGRAFAIERENGCMTALLLAPVDRGLVFFAKLSSTSSCCSCSRRCSFRSSSCSFRSAPARRLPSSSRC
jgi:heme exporter protein B